MTNSNAALANDPAMSKTHFHYEFGTFEERLNHICALFEVDAPEVVYEDGKPTLTDGFIGWIEEHSVNMDWLFGGSPCVMLKKWSEDQKKERKFLEINRQLEPEIQVGLLALLKAVVHHKLPMSESLAVFDQVVKEVRSNQKDLGQ